MNVSTHAKFQYHLRNSEETRALIATWLEGRGYEVLAPETRVAPTQEEWRSYKDDGDLFVNMRLEVKGLSCRFTE